MPQFGGQLADGVVRQGQPTQGGRQRGGRHIGNAVGLEADHVQSRAVAQHFGQRGEVVVRGKQHLQLVQKRQLVRQIAQVVATQVEHLQRVGQGKNLLGQLRQAARQVEAARARQCAAAQLFKGVHGR